MVPPVDSAAVLVQPVAEPQPDVRPEAPPGSGGVATGCCTCHGLWGLLHSFILKMYFRDITIEGQANLPKEGAVVLAANHSNGGMDGIVLFAQFPRVIRFVAKDALLRLPVFGACIRGVGTIPVLRPVDVRASQQAGSQNSISSMFDAVVEALRSGDSVAIFPEGFSHDMSALALDKNTGTLKYGLGEMVMQAHTKDVKVKIVPVGMNYDHKTLFRSSVYLSYGAPVEVSPQNLADYRVWVSENPDERPSSNPVVLEVLSKVQRGIEQVWCNAPSHEIRNEAVLAFEVSSGKTFEEMSDDPKAYYTGVQQFVQLQMRVSNAEEKSSAEEADLLALLKDYSSELEGNGVTNSDVVRKRINPVLMLIKLLVFLVLFVLVLPLSLPGLILLMPIRILCHCIAVNVALSIAKADIKKGLQPEDYKGGDVISTIKVLCAMVLFTLIYPGFAGLGCAFLDGEFGIDAAAWFFILLAGIILASIIAAILLDYLRAIRSVVANTCKSGFCCSGTARLKTMQETHEKLKAALAQWSESAPGLEHNMERATMPKEPEYEAGVPPEATAVVV
eukprot:TRINITY_DN16762_c0_g1_i1.p1 TRINITY_DN16762_c0_g1~~TRINITY_DN16762_c0_g1_i1.p1  ORF type:complete len:561 (+),score=116.72 TRINITY_DN16762_c0_g1_i1:200-1882(+)